MRICKKRNKNDDCVNERKFDGCLYKMLPRLDTFISDAIVTKRPVSISALQEKDIYNYPEKALRELMMNAVMHRDYQSTTPTLLYQYKDRIEIMNPGGLYGNARPDNFPNVNNCPTHQGMSGDEFDDVTISHLE